MQLFQLGLQILADRTAARSVISYWHDTFVCLSVCLFALAKSWPIVASGSLAVRVGGCTRRAVLYFTSSDTFAVGCIAQQRYTQTEKN